MKENFERGTASFIIGLVMLIAGGLMYENLSHTSGVGMMTAGGFCLVIGLIFLVKTTR